MQSSVKNALQYAAQSAGLRDAEIDPGESTETTVRMRLASTVAGADVRFVAEVSGRNPVPKDCQTRGGGGRAYSPLGSAQPVVGARAKLDTE